jgi:drug/metabolite transporter (DMT)-like permease
MVGILLNLGNAGVCWSEKFISSGVAALIVGAIPILFMLFNWLSFEKKVPHFSALFAVIFGIIGISLISANGGNSDWRVVAVLLLANFSWVAGSLKFRMTKSHLSYYPRAAVQLLSGGTTLFIFSNLMGEQMSFSEIKLNGAMSVVYLALAGTVVAYTAYSYLLKNVKTELASTYALINPLVALMLGVMFLGEPFSATLTVSAALILMSVMLTLYGDKLFRKRAAVVVTNEMKKCS